MLATIILLCWNYGFSVINDRSPFLRPLTLQCIYICMQSLRFLIDIVLILANVITKRPRYGFTMILF
jgi:hypothetical protein